MTGQERELLVTGGQVVVNVKGENEGRDAEPGLAHHMVSANP